MQLRASLGNEAHEATVEFERNHQVLYMAISGSDSYGFPSDNSDIDLRGIHRLPLRELLGQFNMRDTLQTKKHHARFGVVEIETHEIGKFAGLILRGKGTVMEQLYSPLTVRFAASIKDLQYLAHQFITRHTGTHYLGFARQEWKQVQTRPTAKKYLYTFRVLLSGIYTMRTGWIDQNLQFLRNELASLVGPLEFLDPILKVKMDGHEFAGYYREPDELEVEFKRLYNMLEAAIDTTALPNEPSDSAVRALEDWVYMTRKGHE